MSDFFVPNFDEMPEGATHYSDVFLWYKVDSGNHEYYDTGARRWRKSLAVTADYFTPIFTHEMDAPPVGSLFKARGAIYKVDSHHGLSVLAVGVDGRGMVVGNGACETMYKKATDRVMKVKIGGEDFVIGENGRLPTYGEAFSLDQILTINTLKAENEALKRGNREQSDEIQSLNKDLETARRQRKLLNSKNEELYVKLQQAESRAQLLNDKLTTSERNLSYSIRSKEKYKAQLERIKGILDEI